MSNTVPVRARSSGNNTISSLDIDLEKVKQGKLGNFFGSSWSMSGYISLLCLLFSFISFLFVIYFKVDNQYALSFPASLLTLSAGLLAGKSLK